eukprot:scaffold1750_cov52-Attheya_sp.AAC.1
MHAWTAVVVVVVVRSTKRFLSVHGINRIESNLLPASPSEDDQTSADDQLTWVRQLKTGLLETTVLQSTYLLPPVSDKGSRRFY